MDAHLWARFVPGLLAGCWIGVIVGAGSALLLMGRRVRQLETINMLLRARLKLREKQQRPTTATTLVMPRPGVTKPGPKPVSRTAFGR